MSHARATLLLVTVILAGCTVQVQTATSRTPAPTVAPVAAPRAVTQLVADLQSEYDRSNWSGVRARVANGSIASHLVGQLQGWKGRGIGGLRIELVYSRRLSAGRYVGTVQFAADSRVVPQYDILVFGVRKGGAHVLGQVTGITGSSYQRANWKVSRTAHFIVYHSRYQLVGADRHFLADIEHQRTQVERKFRIRLPSVAAYYLYPNRTLMARFTGGSCGSRAGEIGCTSPFSSPPTIQDVIQATFHEPIHVYQRALEPAPVQQGSQFLDYVAPLFIAEGMAVALEDREADPRLSDYCSELAYAPLDECAKTGMADVLDPMVLLSDHGFNSVNPGDAYALGGSFVKYLILRYGYYRFGRFYYKLAAQPKDRVRDYNVASNAVYHRPISRLVSAWKKELCPSGC